MSKIALSGNASGTGTFTLASPNSSTDRTLDLPDASGVIDRLNRAGNVLQVVSANNTTGGSTSSTSYVDTGLSASITPTSATSKILVVANMPDLYNNDVNNNTQLNLVRASTQIAEFVKHGNFRGGGGGLVTFGGSVSYLDSPNTTSSTTYKVQIKTSSNTIYWQYASSMATITLMEIAA